MPKPWEAGGSHLDWAGVVPSELEFWVQSGPLLREGVPTHNEVYFRPRAMPSWGGGIPESWVSRHLPLWLHNQVRPAVFFLTAQRPVVDILEELGFRFASELSGVEDGPPMALPLVSLEERIETVFLQGLHNGTLGLDRICHYIRSLGFLYSTEDVVRVVDRMVELGRLTVEPGRGYRLARAEIPLETRIMRVFETVMPQGMLSFSGIQDHLRAGGWEGQPGDIANSIGRLVADWHLLAGVSPGEWRLPQHEDSVPLEDRIAMLFGNVPSGGTMTLAMIREGLSQRGWAPGGANSRALLLALADMVAYSRLVEVPGVGYRLPQSEPGTALADLAREIASDGPYPTLLSAVRAMLTMGWQTREELLTVTRQMVPNVDAEHLDTALDEVLRDSTFMGRTRAGAAGRVWGIRDGAYPGATPEEVAQGWLPSRATLAAVAAGMRAMPADYSQIELRVLAAVDSDRTLEGHIERLLSLSAVPRPTSSILRLLRADPSVTPQQGLSRHFPEVLNRMVQSGRMVRTYAANGSMLFHLRRDEAKPDVADPAQLATSILAVFEDDLGRVYTAGDVHGRLPPPFTYIGRSTLGKALDTLIADGHLWFLRDQTSSGYRLTRRVGADPPSVWDRIVREDE